MSFLFKLFKKSSDEDYETVLSTLSRNIQSRQQKLTDIRLRERRATLASTLWTIAIYVLYVSFWYLRLNTRTRGMERALMAAPVLIGPIIVLFIRRIVQLWYSRIEAREEKTLQGLLKEQRTKVEEIKKKTNFYSTRDLLSKYDDQTPMNSPQPQQILRQRMNGAPPSIPQTPVAGMARPQTQGSNGSAASARAPQGVVNPEPNGLSPSPFLATPTRKQWYDKLADALLGDEDQQTPPSSRYALICEKCFKHNGLVKESMWEDMQYICPKCGHFNQSMRSKRDQARRSASPGSVGSASPSNPVGPPSPTTPSPVRGAKINSGSPPPQTVSSPSSDKMDED